MAVLVITWDTSAQKFFSQIIGDGQIRDLAATKLTGLVPYAAVSGFLPLAGGTMTGTILTNLLNAIRRNADNDEIDFLGGLTFPPGKLIAFGRDHATYPGAVAGVVPNAAKTGEVWAFMFSGATDTPQMVMGTIPNARLKTATGSVSGTLALNTGVGITMNDYSFFPATGKVYVTTGTLPALTLATSADVSGTVGSLSILRQAGATGDYYVGWRYCTSSGPPEIWVGLDAMGKIIAVWEAADPPPESPPIFSDDIEAYIKFNPELELFYDMRQLAGGTVIETPQYDETGKEIKGVRASVESGLLAEAIRQSLTPKAAGKWSLGKFELLETQRLTKAQVEDMMAERETEAKARREAVLAGFM